jgi:hypothetical protein
MSSDESLTDPHTHEWKMDYKVTDLSQTPAVVTDIHYVCRCGQGIMLKPKS